MRWSCDYHVILTAVNFWIVMYSCSVGVIRNSFWLPFSLQEYAAIFAGAGTNPGEKTLEDKFFEKEVRYSAILSPSSSMVEPRLHQWWRWRE